MFKERLAAAEHQAAALRADNGRLSLELTAACRGQTQLSSQLEEWLAVGGLFTEAQQQQEQEADALRARVRNANAHHFESVQVFCTLYRFALSYINAFTGRLSHL